MDRLETAPFIGSPGAPERDQMIGQGGAPAGRRGGQDTCQAVVGVVGGQYADLVARRSCSASASTWRPTPPGYVYESGDTSATRTRPILSGRIPAQTMVRALWLRHFQNVAESGNYFKYTFLKVDPAWRRRPAGSGPRQARVRRRLRRIRRDHYLRAYSLVGTRGDCDLMVRAIRRPRPDPRAARAAEPERADALRGRAPLLPGHDEGVTVLRRARPAARAEGGRRLGT